MGNITKIWCYLLLIEITTVFGWYTCTDKAFCQKIRYKDWSGTSPFNLNVDSAEVSDNSVVASLYDNENQKNLRLRLISLEGNIFRLIIEDPDQERHSVPEALDGEPELDNLNVVEKTNDLITVSSGDSTATLHANPFKVEVYKNGDLIVVINEDGKLTFQTNDDDPAVALDIKFPGAQRAYGLPLHADRLALRTTGTDGLIPYRFYNVDHCCYDTNSQEPLYGTVPVLYAHSTSRTSGVFWLNSAQTFVDINDNNNQVGSFFISESGVIDLFVLTGPDFPTATTQYTKLTGTAPLPPLFSIGYHQSRYSYTTQNDLLTVVAAFDGIDTFPLDVIWLDIDYTNEKRYFTWDYNAFPSPSWMQEVLNSTGRKLVVIIDPHIKVETGYFVYDQGNENGYFVKNADGSNFEGQCWPGLSSYIDFHNPEARNWYASLYHYGQFPEATDIMHHWNDMNEPSVFDWDEETMPNPLVHYGGWTHRDVHNMYGYMQTIATWQGLMERSNYQKRPFLLTRSHFAGQQRYAAIWTGDNMASWEHLRISFPMCLSEALAGISFCGADVGGFINSPDTELLQRWTQAGAWLPFFRQHANAGTDRREPYLFSQDVQETLRKAMRERYFHLPMWYTLWYEHERYGEPVIRPIFYHYPEDENTFDIDDEWLVGSDILVHPVTQEYAQSVEVYLPGGVDTYWFDIENNFLYRGVGYVQVNVNINYTPVFYRGGSIIFRKDIPRPSSDRTHNDPYTIYVFLDQNQEATGNLYVDDYVSFDYRNKQYSYNRLEYKENTLYSTAVDADAYYDNVPIIQTINVYYPPTGMKGAIIQSKNLESSTTVTYNEEENRLVISNVNISPNEPFSMKLF